MSVSEDAVAVLIGVIGGELGVKRVLTSLNISTGSKMYMKMLIGALLLYLGQTNGFYFISNLGVGTAGGGAYEYLLKTGKLS